MQRQLIGIMGSVMLFAVTMLVAGLIITPPRSADAALQERTQLISEARSDAFDGTATVKLILENDGSIAQVESSHPAVGTARFPIQADKAVVARYKGRDAVTLIKKNFDPRTGGTFEINYLNNGIFGLYKTVGELELVREGGKWVMYAAGETGRRPVHSMFYWKRTFLGATIGVETVTME